ncbi:MAG: GNAT family N-acetyltransferase [Calditrichaeota bacterium]|nr:MAG: GNAT family N-acetyltransferase [Calditrichota bacterium]
MLLSDIDFAYACILQEGWDGENKSALQGMFEFGPEGCFLLEERGVRVGVCVAVKYAHSGFIGDLIVLNEFRGKGYGTQLFQHSVNYMESQGITNLYLDAALAAVPIYEREGFRTVDRSLRFIGTVPGKPHAHVRPFQPTDLRQIITMDRKYFGDDRSFFLTRNGTFYPEYCFVFEKNDAIGGFIMGHPGIGVLTVGPWVVWDETVDPWQLLESLVHYYGDKPLRIGALEKHQNTVARLRNSTSFRERVPCLRMVLGSTENVGSHPALISIGSGAKG